jgi:hypothetical protein
MEATSIYKVLNDKIGLCKTCEAFFRNSLEDEILTEEDEKIMDEYFENFAPGLSDEKATLLQNDSMGADTKLSEYEYYIMIKDYRCRLMMCAMDEVYWSTDGQKRLLVRDAAKHKLAQMAVERNEGVAGLRKMVMQLVEYIKRDETYEDVDCDYLDKVFG